MNPLAVLKLLKEAKVIYNYVRKKNSLDMQMEMVLNRLDNLEQNSHPPVLPEKDARNFQDQLKDLKKRMKKLSKK